MYDGYCPDLFPRGGVCDADSDVDAYHDPSELVARDVNDLQCEGLSPLDCPLISR